MSEKTLKVLMGGRPVAVVHQDPSAGGKFRLAYDDEYIETGRTPLSMSLPLFSKVHHHGRVGSFMWNLLPDNRYILDGWGKFHQVSSGNPFALLSAVGEDCAGGVQFVRPERLASIARTGDVAWVDEAEVGRRLGSLRSNISSAGRNALDHGFFSLAGAQPKTALFRDGHRWGIPSGTVPTTHILKPPIDGLDGQTENEHFCLRLSARMGIRTARSEVVDFGGEKAIVVERYDRLRTASGEVRRIHQEDMCQALGIMPDRKYQQEGGPGIRAIMQDVLRHSDDANADRQTFMSAVAFNFCILGTDAHAKNFSILHSTTGRVRLAPVYDIASFLPYTDEPHVMKLPMSIGGRYEFQTIMPRHWEKEAKACSYSGQAVLAEVARMCQELPDAASEVACQCRSEGLEHPVFDKLVDRISGHCRRLSRLYGRNCADDVEQDAAEMRH